MELYIFADIFQPKLRRHMGETGSVNLETRLDKLKRRRESITGLRKRSRSRDTGEKTTHFCDLSFPRPESTERLRT